MVQPTRRTGKCLALWGKGGAGKTTSALALASLAAADGLHTVILDADPQRSASAWYSSSNKPGLAVHSTDVMAVPHLLRQARARYDLVIIDNPPALYGGSDTIARNADVSLVLGRPFPFDLNLAVDWVSFLKRVNVKPLIALTAAPSKRLDKDAPTVEWARKRLGQAGGFVWHHEVTHRLVYPELIRHGMTVVDLPVAAPARNDYEMLWASIRKKFEAISHA